jgi:xanthine dehydrogenase YagT iron-sulfur-binding subunit
MTAYLNPIARSRGPWRICRTVARWRVASQSHGRSIPFFRGLCERVCAVLAERVVMNPRDRLGGARALAVPLLNAGDLVPDLVFEDDRGEAVSLRSLRGRPFVLAVSSQWNAGGGPPVREDELRAELRGLGAALLVVSPWGPWFLEADDPRRDLALRGAAGGNGAVYHALGVPRDDGGAHPLVLFVIDARGTIRKVHAEPASPREALAVLTALRAAMEAMRAWPALQPLLLNRRELLISTLVSAVALLALSGCGPTAPAEGPTPASPSPTGPTASVKLHVNGTERALTLEPRVTLLDALREQLGLTGTKKGCDHGQCGACTVLVDGRRINACLTLAVMHQKAQITTIEGLARGDDLHPMQAAFIEHDAFQCGYCTPGQILSAVALVAEQRARDEVEIRELMSGNVCRCGAYPNIVAAIQDVQKRG